MSRSKVLPSLGTTGTAEDLRLNTGKIRTAVSEDTLAARALVRGQFSSPGRYVIEPEVAELLLMSSKGNRPQSKASVDRIAKHMSNGTYEFNGEPVIIDEDGSLRDGHHRCAASVASGKAFDTFVVSGVPATTAAGLDVQFTMDEGNNRTLAQALKMLNVPNTADVASATKATLANGRDGYAATIGKISNIELMDHYNHHAEAIRWTSVQARRLWNRTGCPQAPLAAFVWQAASRSDRASVEAFVDDLCDLTAGGVLGMAAAKMMSLGDGSAKDVRYAAYRYLRYAWDQDAKGFKRLRLPEDSTELPAWGRTGL